MAHEVFNYSQTLHIAVLTINHPESRNALNPEILVKLAEKVAANGPLAVTAVRRSVREAIGVSELQGLDQEIKISASIYATENAPEGPKAFMEKRKPVFNDR